MPRDEWKRAREAQRAKQRKASEYRHSTSCRRDLPEAVLDPNRIASRMNGSTPLWFGKWKNTPLRDVPTHYLRWLAANCTDTKSRPIQGLLLWIREHIPN
jgi:hypothetical protein